MKCYRSSTFVCEVAMQNKFRVLLCRKKICILYYFWYQNKFQRFFSWMQSLQTASWLSFFHIDTKWIRKSWKLPVPFLLKNFVYRPVIFRLKRGLVCFQMCLLNVNFIYEILLRLTWSYLLLIVAFPILNNFYNLMYLSIKYCPT